MHARPKTPDAAFMGGRRLRSSYSVAGYVSLMARHLLIVSLASNRHASESWHLIPSS
jgi:hypothetical protein